MSEQQERPELPAEVVRACVRALAHFRAPAQVAADPGVPEGRVLADLAALDLAPFDPPDGPDAETALAVLARACYRTRPQIAAELGLPPAVVRRVLAAADLPVVQPGRARSAVARRVQALAPTHTVPEIAARLGVPRTVVATALRYAGDAPKPERPRRPRDAVPPPGPWEEPTPGRPAPLAEIRRRRGLSRAGLADALEVGYGTVLLWEAAHPTDPSAPLRDRSDADAVVLAGRLAHALGVDPLAIADCLPALRPAAADLPAPVPGTPDHRAVLLPVARWLRLGVARRGWTVAALAAHAGAHRSSALAWINGRTFPQARLAERLARLFPGPGVAEDLAAWRAAWQQRDRTPPPAPQGALWPRRNAWDAEQDAVLLAHPHLTGRDLGALLGRTATAIKRRRQYLRARGRAET